MTDTAFARLQPVVQHHVVNTLQWPGLRALQSAAVEPVLDGVDCLLLAPTAGGKTEAATFPLLSRMAAEGWTGISGAVRGSTSACRRGADGPISGPIPLRAGGRRSTRRSLIRVRRAVRERDVLDGDPKGTTPAPLPRDRPCRAAAPRPVRSTGCRRRRVRGVQLLCAVGAHRCRRRQRDPAGQPLWSCS